MAATDPRPRGQGRLDPDGARAIAERLHYGQREAGGKPLLDHVRRVVAAVPLDARVVAWLHEVFEYTSIPEETLLAEGLRTSELRALRLLTRDRDSASDASYLAHVEMLVLARGGGAEVARTVKRADLADRLRHPAGRPGSWRPPYERALALLKLGALPELPTPASTEAPAARLVPRSHPASR